MAALAISRRRTGLRKDRLVVAPGRPDRQPRGQHGCRLAHVNKRNAIDIGRRHPLAARDRDQRSFLADHRPRIVPRAGSKALYHRGRSGHDQGLDRQRRAPKRSDMRLVPPHAPENCRRGHGQAQVAQSQPSPAGREGQAAAAVDGIQDGRPQGVGAAAADAVNGHQHQAHRGHYTGRSQIDDAVAAPPPAGQRLRDDGQREEQSGQRGTALRPIIKRNISAPYGSTAGSGSLPMAR